MATILEQLQNNPITVSLIPLDFSEGGEDRRSDFSGRVVYALENVDEEDEEWDELCFTCGPETTDKSLEDTYDLGCYNKLTTLFADFPTWGNGFSKLSGVDVGAAENFHEVQEEALQPHGISFQEAWKIVKARLERSGAVPFEYN